MREGLVLVQVGLDDLVEATRQGMVGPVGEILLNLNPGHVASNFVAEVPLEEGPNDGHILFRGELCSFPVNGGEINEEGWTEKWAMRGILLPRLLRGCFRQLEVLRKVWELPTRLIAEESETLSQ